MIAHHTHTPDSDLRSIVGRGQATLPNALSRRLGPPEPDPAADVSRWEDDGGAVLPPAELAA